MTRPDYGPAGSGAVRGTMAALAMVLPLWTLLALLLLPRGADAAVVPTLPTIYTSCVGNAHVSDICLGG